MKYNVLFIVYYLPPMGASGVQRPLKFIKYLSQYDWHPIVLAPEPGAYHTFDSSLAKEFDRCDAAVERVQAETPFHKWSTAASLIGKLPEQWKRRIRKLSYGLMLPDNKKGWIRPALKKAKQLISNRSIDLVFSTAPPYSNLLIASHLKQEMNLPVIMDFRDDWLESQLIEYPTRWHKWRMARLEEKTVREADAITVLDTFMRERFRSRYGNSLPATYVIPHGYDPEDFENEGQSNIEYEDDALNLLYSGTFNHMNQPDPFFHSVKKALQKQPSLKEKIILHFQGGMTKRHYEVLKQLNLSDMVKDYGYLPHKTAVANLMRADALWLISDYGPEHRQATSGKLFEYIGTGKPIYGMIYEKGEEERLLKRYKASYIVRPDNPDQGADSLLQLFKDWERKQFPEPDKGWIRQFDRVNLTEQLAGLFNHYRSPA